MILLATYLATIIMMSTALLAYNYEIAGYLVLLLVTFNAFVGTWMPHGPVKLLLGTLELTTYIVLMGWLALNGPNTAYTLLGWFAFGLLLGMGRSLKNE